MGGLLLLQRFAERLRERSVTINAVHPGVVRTGLGDRPGLGGLLLRGVKLFWRTLEDGASPVVRLALDPALEGVSGRYFHRDVETPLAEVARNSALAERLWEQASTLTGLRLDEASRLLPERIWRSLRA